ncbi:MAG TPA: hypothetical protein OIL76_00575 [Veillonellaceae bacterium]|nr:hypothetical protein [Veillonellaceae bacterium]
MNILEYIKKHLGVSGTVMLIGIITGFLAIYLDVIGLAYVSIIFCGVSLLINKDGNINL